MSVTNNNSSDLQYAISAKDAFLVISFTGKMTKASSSLLEACLNEVTLRSEQKVVLNFNAVTQIDRPVIPALIKLQKTIRDRTGGSAVRVCHMEPEMSGLLIDAGAIRREELKKNLQEALASFAPPQKLVVKNVLKGAA